MNNCFSVFAQNCNTSPAIALKEKWTCSFIWEVDDFAIHHVDSTVASQCFVTVDNERWRGVWKKALFLQLQSSVNQVTVKIRWVKLLSGQFFIIRKAQTLIWSSWSARSAFQEELVVLDWPSDAQANWHPQRDTRERVGWMETLPSVYVVFQYFENILPSMDSLFCTKSTS